VNISWIFTELDFMRRFRAARKHGFNGVEILFPYQYDKSEIYDQLRLNNLELVLLNMPPGQLENGDRGLACDPNRVGEFQDSVELAIDFAKNLDCRNMHCMAGIKPSGFNNAQLQQTFIENLIFAADEAAKEGITVLLEPINFFDIPNYFLNYSDHGISIIKELNKNNVKLQYDVYHMQIMEENLTSQILKHIEYIAHFQIADNPGRHEPGTGEINYQRIFNLIDNLSYRGWVGCEYNPLKNSETSLNWIKQLNDN